MRRYLTFQQLKKKRVHRSLSYKNFYKRRNDRKGRYSAHFWENCKKDKKNWSNRTQKSRFVESFQIINQRTTFFCSCDLIFNFFFLQFFQKCTKYIDPSGCFVFYEILCSSNFLGRTSPRCCSRGSPGGWIKISLLQQSTCRYLQ